MNTSQECARWSEGGRARGMAALFLSMCMLAAGCNFRREKSQTTTGLTGTFSSISSNILVPKCASCHSSPSSSCGATACGSLDTGSYAQVAARTVAGSPSSSTFYKRVTTQAPIMPTNGSALSSEEQQAIFDWILNGAQNN